MADFSIKQDDLLPILTATLQDAAGTPVNLTGGTVVFSMAAPGGAVKVDRQTATVVSAPAGTVSYTWQAGDTDTVGLYLAEFEVTFSGKKQSFPNDGSLVVAVVADVA